MSGQQKILIADDDAAMRIVLGQAFTREGFEVRTTSSGAALQKWACSGEGDLIVSDVLMSGEAVFAVLPEIRRVRPKLPIILMSGQNTLLTAVSAAQTGAFEYLPKPFDIKDMLAAARRALARQVRFAPAEKAKAVSNQGLPLIGRSPVMQEVYRTLARLTHTDLTVLIQGESGTGKDLAARALHELGRRRTGRFVGLPLAATPREKVESELFGSEIQPGKLVEADGGTLFLDEIGDLPLDAQMRLLGVIDGSDRPINRATGRPVVPRIIASTSRDLRDLLNRGLFREDLYFRLNVAPVRMPPLRERPEDIVELAHVFLLRATIGDEAPRVIDQFALERLQKHSWPGNVRELENLIRRMCVLYPHETITARIVHRELTEFVAAPISIDPGLSLAGLIERRLGEEFLGGPENLPEAGLFERIVNEISRPLLRITLAATRGNQVRAAEVLGLNRNTLKKKLHQLGMPTTRRELAALQRQQASTDAGAPLGSDAAVAPQDHREKNGDGAGWA